MIKKLDIDRLHHNIERLYVGQPRSERGRGRTTAFKYLMLGEVETGSACNDYLYIGHNSHQANVVLQDMRHLILSEVGHNTALVSTRSFKVLDGDQRFTFVGIDELAENGFVVASVYYDRVFIDLSLEEHSVYDHILTPRYCNVMDVVK